MCSKDGGWGGGGGERKGLFSRCLTIESFLPAGDMYVYVYISIVQMGIPPVPYIVYMQNRNNCVCDFAVKERKERRTNPHKE